jgi:hypothetical protein
MASLAIRQLQDSYARKLGELRKLERETGVLRRDLRKLEQAMQVFDPALSGGDIRPIKPRKPSRWGKRGRGMIAAMEVLRDADRPLTTRQIIVRVLERLDMPAPPPKEMKRIVASFSGAFARKPLMQRIEGKPSRWVLEGGWRNGSD